jgi:hypothetical protein
MSERTLGQMLEAREAREKSAAMLLGQMLFEFARLDVALGLCIVWADGGRHVEARTKQFAELTFHKKLDILSREVRRLPESEAQKRAAYSDWTEAAHSARLLRNELVHGRWVFDPISEHAVNVIGLPTSPEQREVKYTIADLAGALESLKSLQGSLRELRDRWPL